MRKFQIVSLSQYGFPQKALTDDLVREHLTRRGEEKEGKEQQNKRGRPQTPDQGTGAKARRRGPQGGSKIPVR